jgi:hypothetical protein
LRKQAELVMKARKLQAQVNMLPDPDARKMFIKELKNVLGLLAYKVPEKSPVASYLKQDRRDALAAQVNSAILCMSPLLSNCPH